MSSTTNQRVLSATTIGRSVVDQEDLKPCWKSEKGHISQDDQEAYYSIYKFFKDLTKNRKKIIRTVIFRHRPFHNSLKYKDYK